MSNFGNFRLWTVAAFSCAIAGCQSTTAPINGSGYQFVRFTDPKAAIAASQDPTAGPAIAGNNERCRQDEACRK
jgi:hypothetical protein